MADPPMVRLKGNARREAMTRGYENGVLWSIGNGLTTGTIIYYLAFELGARGRGVSWILAAPALVGLLRLAAPPVIRAAGGVKQATLAMSLASYLLLATLLLLIVPGLMPDSVALAFLICVICLHQLLEYLGAVALWSWLAEIVPQRIRGRYFARRQIWQLAFLIPTLLASAWFTDMFRKAYRSVDSQLLIAGYLIPVGIGTLCLLASLWPLWKIPAVRLPGQPAAQTTGVRLLAPLADGRFRRLLLFGCWFSFFNGLTQSAQNLFPYIVLDLGVMHLAMMRTVMRCGQVGLAPWVGRASDRFGNRPVLVVCQLCVASGPLFFLLATPERWWLLFGAWIAWSAYVGLNVCLPNLMLKLSPEHDNSAYIATYFAVTSVFYAGSTLLGGAWFDSLPTDARLQLAGLDWSLDRYQFFFLVGWITRTMGILFLLRVIEPGARTWRELLGR